MRALMERAERLAADAQRRRIDELAARIAERLPRAKVERQPSGLSVRGFKLMKRWLGDTELRFVGSARR